MNLLALRSRSGSGVALTLVLALGPAAALSEPATLGVELSTGRQQLSNGSPDWTEHAARLSQRRGVRDVTELGLVQTERFGLRDEQLSGLIVRPLDGRLTATLDASLSPTHRVLARHHLGGSLQYEFAPAWLVHGGLRHTRYDSNVVNQGQVMLEHYVGRTSWLAAWRPVHTQGRDTSSLELRGSYYYGELSSASLSLSDGREAVLVGGGDVRLADVRAAVFSGRHWWRPDWALAYEWGVTHQGDFYTRRGWRVGVQHLF
ncbi:MAG: YaiO family outer membrane beta-barrel protein [Hylemonella sp.]|uniref:YaiO family outer membrane beta-barrel protein n=1 Tax=Hylemonella sp. TaxID=2066020 RepID=UPI0022C0B148|nr:YaiO family outer membrane beta-barrel protein [Hylemonella sp.]MCZ8252987.1 YaiO family outer membrane beta-barrel protein [Hylemonella sp.]